MIDVTEVVKSHGSTRILRGVNLKVAKGEVAAIIGPSGSGKSTFLRCLNGLESFESGCVTIDGPGWIPWPHRETAWRFSARSVYGSGWFFNASTYSRTGLRSRT